MAKMLPTKALNSNPDMKKMFIHVCTHSEYGVHNVRSQNTFLVVTPALKISQKQCHCAVRNMTKIQEKLIATLNRRSCNTNPNS